MRVNAFWGDPILYSAALGVVVSLLLLIYLVGRWRRAWNDEGPHVDDMLPEERLKVAPPVGQKEEAPPAEVAPVIEPEAPQEEDEADAAPEPMPEPSPQELPRPAERGEGTDVVGPSSPPASRAERLLSEVHEVHDQLTALTRDIKEMQTLLQGLENKRAAELSEIQSRLAEIETRLAETKQGRGPVFPV